MHSSSVRTRFAPSPTGALHLGGVRTALFSWLHARNRGGRFLLRIEDTDRARNSEGAVASLRDGLAWLGLDADEEPVRQSRRLQRYREAVAGLLEAGRAYRCYCTRQELEAMRAAARAEGRKPRYDGRCRDRRLPPPGGAPSPAIRFRSPRDGRLKIADMVQGSVAFDNAELDDLVIARSDGSPTYHLTVVVDDRDMGITDVIRGDDHLNNTPRQLHLIEALGAAAPRYAHVPMILGPDGNRLSKRHDAGDVLQYRRQGYLPEALLNYLARLGWSRGDRELFRLGELVEHFDIGAVSRAAARFDPDKMRWCNQQHMLRRCPGDLAGGLRAQLLSLGVTAAGIAAGPELRHLAEVQRERHPTLREMARASLAYYRAPEGYEPRAAVRFLQPAALPPLQELRRRLGGLASWRAAAIGKEVEEVAARHSLPLGKVAQPVRVAVCGTPVSPPIDVTLELLGRRRTLARLWRGIACIERQATAGKEEAKEQV